MASMELERELAVVAGDQAQSQVTAEIIATGVSFEEYLDKYAGDFCELVEGNVIKMSPIHEDHDKLTRYLASLLDAYFEIRPIGQIRIAPFVMKISSDSPKREPDLQIILNTNLGELKPTYMDGPADICIEIISPGSVDEDRGKKFTEYEKGGVGEYWIFDPIHKEALFYRLNAEGIYAPQQADADGNYRTPALPGLVLHVPTLWQEQLPGPIAVAQAVQAMVKE
jgi:Uma2 family endonuclease